MSGPAGALSSKPFPVGDVVRAGGPVVLVGPDGRPVTSGDFGSPFNYGPGQPLRPRLPEKDRPPWEFQYPQGWNVMPVPRGEQVGGKRFDDLRAYAALSWDARSAINYRKAQITGLKWRIQPREDGNSRTLRDEWRDDITRVETFFRKPNRIDGVSMHQFLKQVIEEILVTDATTFWKHPCVDGTPHSFIQINGATIKPLIDEFGHVVGYQQILFGYPAVEYHAYGKAESDADGMIDSANLRYCIYNPRVDSVYGTSALEDVAPLLDIAIMRQINQLAWYTEGNIPTATMEAPAGWTLDQIASAQAYYDRLLSGNEEQRHKVRIVPPGSKFTSLKPFQFSKDEDDAIKRAICSAFQIPPTALVSETNRATAKQVSEDMHDIGARPLRGFLEDHFSTVIAEDFELPELEWKFVIDESGSEKERAESLTMYVGAKIMTEDEARARIDLDPYTPEQKAEKLAEQQAVMAQMQPGGGFEEKPKPGQPPPKGPKGTEPKTEDKPEPKPAINEKAAIAELRTWERFASKRLDKGKQAALFATMAVPDEIKAAVEQVLPLAKSEREVRAIFDTAIEKAKKYRVTATDKKAHQARLKQIIMQEFERQKHSAISYYHGKVEAA